MFLKKLDKAVGPLLARLWLQPTRPDPLHSPVSRLLLIRPGGIGDAVLLAPTIKLLRDVFPEARLEVLAEARNRGVFAFCPGIDEVLCYDSPRELLAVLRRNYDVVIDTEQWHYLSALVTRVIRSGTKIGFGTNQRQRLFTHPVEYNRDNYELHIFFELLKPLGIEAPATIPSPFLTIQEKEHELAGSLLGAFLEEPFVVLFPGASTSEKCWAVENFRQLAGRFFDKGLPVVVVGGKEEVVAGSIIVAGTCGLNLAGETSLGGTASVLSRSQLLVSGDSGVLHIGAGLGVPTVSLFGPGDPAKWAPRGKQHVAISHKLPCAPCTRFGTTPSCPINAKCILGISVDEVFVAAQKLLALT